MAPTRAQRRLTSYRVYPQVLRGSPDVLLFRTEDRVIEAMLSDWRHRCSLGG